MLYNVEHIYTTILISCQIVYVQSYCFKFVFRTTSILDCATITRQKTMFCFSTNCHITYIIPAMELYEKGGIDAERLSDFLTKYITTKYSNKVVVLDNAGAELRIGA